VKENKAAILGNNAPIYEEEDEEEDKASQSSYTPSPGKLGGESLIR